MAEMTNVSDVEKALRQLWDEKGPYSLHDKSFNEKLKTAPISTLKEMGFNFEGTGFDDDHTVVIINKDPHADIQHNDDKAKSWSPGQDKYVIRVPKPEDEKQFASFADYLVSIYGHPVKGGITDDGL